MAGEEEELGGCYSREKTAGNDKGCKYLPLPGPGSCAELTGPRWVAGEWGGGLGGSRSRERWGRGVSL